MALDNAQFISELSATDPPGTDPVNEGDDHIRTIKTAVQQSFPNVGSAVPQTGTQMAQMAIKNEANRFTNVNTFDAPILLTPFSTAAAPAYSFDLDAATGMYRDTANRLSFGTAGVLRGFFDATGFTSQSIVKVADGSAAAPSFTFTNFPTTGLIADSNSVNAVANGVLVWSMSTNGMFAGAGFQISADGALTDPLLPGFSFGNDSDTGIFRRSANAMGFASGGVEIVNIGTGGIGVVAGKLCFFNLPTSPSTGGSLWNDGGIVKVA